MAKATPEQELALTLTSFGFAADATQFSAKTAREDDAASGLKEFLRQTGYKATGSRGGKYIKMKKGKYTFVFNLENAWRKTSWTLEKK